VSDFVALVRDDFTFPDRINSKFAGKEQQYVKADLLTAAEEEIARLTRRLADLETRRGIWETDPELLPDFDGTIGLAGHLGPVAYEDLPDRATGAVRREYSYKPTDEGGVMPKCGQG
jgi:hypothetical protein